MARRSQSSGLTIGQVLTLTLGFLVASLLIFVFGIWVGKDLVERRLAQEERVVRKPADRTELAEAKGAEPVAEVDVTAQEKTKVPAALAAAPTATVQMLIAAPTQPVRLVPVTTTPAMATAAPTAPARPTRPAAVPTQARPAAHAAEEWADAGWTVQVYATTDPNQATALARKLLSKGYDAYTLQAPMRGQTWYRVRVGRFSNRDRAREMELKLKKQEGLEAAYVTAQ